MTMCFVLYESTEKDKDDQCLKQKQSDALF